MIFKHIYALLALFFVKLRTKTYLEKVTVRAELWGVFSDDGILKISEKYANGKIDYIKFVGDNYDTSCKETAVPRDVKR